MKKKWGRPILVELFRGKPEERVLCGCKVYPTIAGPKNNYHQCYGRNYCGDRCRVCYESQST